MSTSSAPARSTRRVLRRLNDSLNLPVVELTEAIGPGWITRLDELRALDETFRPGAVSGGRRPEVASAIDVVVHIKAHAGRRCITGIDFDPERTLAAH